MAARFSEQRFWATIKIGKCDECWRWRGRIVNGHGVLMVRGRRTTAARVAYALTHGIRLEEMPKEQVKHRCKHSLCCNPEHLITGVEQRFWSKVDKRGPDECWPWKGVRSSDGYGAFKIKGVFVGAHRVAYAIHARISLEQIPAEVCHHCDNPPCVNPDHLFLGTHQDNMTDRNKKGRTRGGNKWINK